MSNFSVKKNIIPLSNNEKEQQINSAKLINSHPIPQQNENDKAEQVFTISLAKFSNAVFSFPSSKHNYFVEQEPDKTLIKSIIMNRGPNEFLIRFTNKGGDRDCRVVFY